MRIKLKTMAVLTVLAFSCAGQTQRAPDKATDIGRSTDAEVEAWLRDRLDRGALVSDNLAAASVYRSSVVIPATLQKFEEVLNSSNPASCFSEPNVDPKLFLRDAPYLITTAGNEAALKAASQLIKIDEARFGWMVSSTLYSAMGYRNTFVVAYRGFALGDPAVNRRIAEWTEKLLSLNAKSTQQEWAEAMVEKYTVVPSAEQWASDPIATRLTPKTLGLVRASVTRLAADTLEKRGKG